MLNLSGGCRVEPMLNSKCLLIVGNTISLSHLWKHWRCDYGSPLETGGRTWWCCPCSPKFVSVCWFWPVWSCLHLQAQTDWKCSRLWSLSFKFMSLSPSPLHSIRSSVNPNLHSCEEQLDCGYRNVLDCNNKVLHGGFALQLCPYTVLDNTPFHAGEGTEVSPGGTL